MNTHVMNSLTVPRWKKEKDCRSAAVFRRRASLAPLWKMLNANSLTIFNGGAAWGESAGCESGLLLRCCSSWGSSWILTDPALLRRVGWLSFQFHRAGIRGKVRQVSFVQRSKFVLLPRLELYI